MRRETLNRLHPALVTATLLTFASSCYRLGKGDIFEIPFHPLSATSLSALSDEHHRLQMLPISASRPVSAYLDEGDSARGVLLFFDGNGYGAEAALRRMLVPARALHLDLIVFNYYDEGQPRPSMQEMRGICHALYDRATTVPTSPGNRVYVGGHSLGATFALFTAADRPVTGVFLAAPATTGVAMLHHQLPVTRFVWLRPDDDYRQFDNLTLAPSVHAPTIVFGSDADEALPPTFTHAVYSALPSTIVKQEVILTGVSHSEYFAQEKFWRQVSEFFNLPVSGPLVGYLR